jgi:hypothetical protein
LVGKTKILEESQNANICGQTEQKQPFFWFSLKFFHPNSSTVIYQDDGKKHQNIFGDKRHIEVTTACKNEQPSKALRQQVEECHHHRKKKQEFDGVKKHSNLSSRKISQKVEN